MSETKPIFSYIGLSFGAIALMLALVHFWAGPFSPQPSLEQTVAEKSVTIKKITLSLLKEKPIVEPEKKSTMDIDSIASLATAVLGGLAIILGVFGYAQKESIRVAGGAAVLGGIAIAFQVATIAIGAIVVAILVAAVLNGIT